MCAVGVLSLVTGKVDAGQDIDTYLDNVAYNSDPGGHVKISVHLHKKNTEGTGEDLLVYEDTAEATMDIEPEYPNTIPEWYGRLQGFEKVHSKMINNTGTYQGDCTFTWGGIGSVSLSSTSSPDDTILVAQGGGKEGVGDTLNETHSGNFDCVSEIGAGFNLRAGDAPPIQINPACNFKPGSNTECTLYKFSGTVTRQASEGDLCNDAPGECTESYDVDIDIRMRPSVPKPKGPCFDASAFAQTLDANAQPTSTGFCGRYVDYALNHKSNGGEPLTQSLNDGHPSSAGQFGPWLASQWGFASVATINPGATSPPSDYVPQVGDIAVFQITQNHPYGHIEGWDGTQWVSDWKQHGFNPYVNQSTSGSATIYRNPNASTSGCPPQP